MKCPWVRPVEKLTWSASDSHICFLFARFSPAGPTSMTVLLERSSFQHHWTFIDWYLCGHHPPSPQALPETLFSNSALFVSHFVWHCAPRWSAFQAPLFTCTSCCKWVACFSASPFCAFFSHYLSRGCYSWSTCLSFHEWWKGGTIQRMLASVLLPLWRRDPKTFRRRAGVVPSPIRCLAIRSPSTKKNHQ